MDTLRTRLYIAIFITAVVVVIMYFVYKWGSKSGAINQSAPVIDNPNNPVDNTTPVTPQAEIDQLATSVYNDFGVYDALGHDMDLWTRVIALSDTDFVNLNNTFNQKYQTSSGKSFAKWIDSQTTWLLWNGDTWGVDKDILDSKISKLNLS